MSLQTKSSSAGYQYNGGIYGKTSPKNDIIVLNIKSNTQTNNEDKSTQLNETEANLQDNDNFNKININKSVKQMQIKIKYYIMIK